ncbi:MAG: IS21 family transposase [Phycisphaerales bacterium]
MTHRLRMAKVQAIRQLHALKWSARQIARELEIDRGTVGRYLRQLRNEANAAIPPAGPEGSNAATFPRSPAPPVEGSDGAGCAAGKAEPNSAIPPAGAEGDRAAANAAIPPAGAACGGERQPAGRRSACEPYRELVLAKLEQGLSAQRIFQDLVDEHGFKAAYDSVKRFARSLGREAALPMRRIERDAGYEAQVDFGQGARIVTAEGKCRKTHVFRVVLSHSRKAYSEATYRQTTEDFIGCLEDAFRHFGGVPRTVVIDNLRAAVKRADWFDPELVPRLEAFCRHYGTVILPTKPRMPRHKGKVERGVGYVQDNGLKARQFHSLEAENQHLLDWETNVADNRLHGTTRKHVGKSFAEIERPTLLPLPLERFPCFHEAQRKVHRDGHIEVALGYYSVPPEYYRRTVWVRWDARLVRIFNVRLEQIALHLRQEPGRFSTHPEHIRREKINGLEQGVSYLLGKVKGNIGPQAHAWAEAMLVARGIEGTRVLLGLLSLGGRHTASALEKACQIALSYKAFRLQTLRELVKRKDAEEQQPLPFLDQHAIIRPLDDYAQVVADALERKRASEVRFKRHGWAKEYRPPHNTNGPAGSDQQGQADILPPRSGYPLSGCSPAEPDSVSPDASSVVPPPSPHHPPEENHEDE